MFEGISKHPLCGVLQSRKVRHGLDISDRRGVVRDRVGDWPQIHRRIFAPSAECADYRRDDRQYGSAWSRLRTLPLGTAYAVWTGIGTAGTVILGMALLGEPVEPLRLGCISFDRQWRRRVEGAVTALGAMLSERDEGSTRIACSPSPISASQSLDCKRCLC